jgi:hypothetical protein
MRGARSWCSKRAILRRSASAGTDSIRIPTDYADARPPCCRCGTRPPSLAGAECCMVSIADTRLIRSRLRAEEVRRTSAYVLAKYWTTSFGYSNRVVVQSHAHVGIISPWGHAEAHPVLDLTAMSGDQTRRLCVGCPFRFPF